MIYLLLVPVLLVGLLTLVFKDLLMFVNLSLVLFFLGICKKPDKWVLLAGVLIFFAWTATIIDPF